ncbi:MAG: MBL fold metallo-hydrolase [Patescibacteria group bacterium]
MIITWLGHSCFKLQDKTGADGVTLITDPYSKDTGFKMPSFEADLMTISHDHKDHNNVAAVKGNPFVINCAGEYDVKGIFVEGIDSFHDQVKGKERGSNVIYRMEIEDISIAHLGDLAHALDDVELEKLVGTDILLIPVGGVYTLDAKRAVEVISQIEPRIVIPMHYRHPDLKFELDDLDKFIKELGLTPTYEEKLKISKKDLPAEEMELVVLSF